MSGWKIVVAAVVVVGVIASVGYGILVLKETSEKAQQTMEEIGEQVKEKLEPPKIIDVIVDTGTTYADIYWTTTKSAACWIKVERLGVPRFSGSSSGTLHHVRVLPLLPGKQYKFIIEAKSETGSDSHEGTFKTERR